MNVIELADVSRWYGSILGLSRVSLGFSSGVTALLGPNGAGKSTLLKLVTGILRPSSGAVTVLGEPPFANPRTYERLGVVPEEEELRVRASAMEWLTYLLRLRGLGEVVSRERAEASLNAVGLAKARDARVSRLSRGLKQRLRIAQAAAHEPDILILDEPLMGLDPVGRRDVIEWIRRWGAEGKTVVVSSHILHEVELMTREVVLMAAGRVLANGNIHEIRRLMDAHPHRIWVTTPDPRALARRLFDAEGLDSISYSEESSQVRMETRQPDRFYAILSEIAMEDDVVIEEITSPDDNLETLFHYLVES